MALLNRLDEVGLTVNPGKCEFGKESLEFFGMQFSTDGISITPGKIRALREAREPINGSELMSFLGLASYCSRAIPKFAEISKDLWDLTKKSTKYEWSEKHKVAFESIKTSVIEGALGYFNINWHTMLTVDASPSGVAAILTQSNPVNVEEKRVISFWSKALSEVEQRYSQVEKEALAVVLACEKYRMYLVGAEFEIRTDNKAVELIYRNPISKPPARIARWLLRLMEYKFRITHIPGTGNMADYLSRHAMATEEDMSDLATEADHYVSQLQERTAPDTVSRQRLRIATNEDPTLSRIIEMLEKNIQNANQETAAVRHIWKMRDEFRIITGSCLETQELLLLRPFN